MTTSTTKTPDQDVSSVPVTKSTAEDARQFLMKNESYCTLDLPEYFDFAKVLGRIAKTMSDQQLATWSSQEVRSLERVNHTIISNKRGRLDWRPIQLIHPVIYVEIANTLTEEENWSRIQSTFEKIESHELITCASVPRISVGNGKDIAENIRSWWTDYEQRSIDLAMEFKFMAAADLVDCYSSVYTHTISWALHTKAAAKSRLGRKSDSKLLGDTIDKLMMDMHQGQTNGIPQGSVLADIIAEIVLGYLDHCLVRELSSRGLSKPGDVRILRYRDDYRMFVKDERAAHTALQALTEAARELGFKLNSAKTSVSADIITAAIREEKMEWRLNAPHRRNLLDGLLEIRHHGLKFPDAGSLRQALTRYFKRIQRSKGSYYRVPTLASITIDIGLRNPTTYPHVAAILSVLIDMADADDRDGIIRAAVDKFQAEPYSGHVEIWLQRVVRKVTRDHSFTEPLCKRFDGEEVPIWDSNWINSNALKDAVSQTDFIDRERFEEMGTRVDPSEVELFGSHYGEG